MNRQMVKDLVDMIPDNDIDIVYQVLVRFIPVAQPLPDELDAIREARTDMEETVPHDAINWD